ncbi:CoA-binding protein [Halobacteriovorax sp. GB3]|uniref:CoA-binding protein n=1 Tax=Halobacteriovorax sp. GB3 TaxID=2719615 RepID=UPI00235FA95C|nr:CoA-binding protein [Halobacteriovorax sp. GB3]MDD0854895.1 CoA-binding protein [Halobacteriovorax sp. GB3]
MSSEKVIILGASDCVDRYSYKAMKMLEDHGHETILVHPKLSEIEGRKVFSSLSELKGKYDTLTVYVNSKISSQLKDEILKLDVGRVIFNPGTENDFLESELTKNNISTERACTLVLLSTDQF